MSSIFKKLSVLFCCLFGLVSLNSVVLAKPGDYLVYFLGNDTNNDILECSGCKQTLLSKTQEFCNQKLSCSKCKPCEISRLRINKLKHCVCYDIREQRRFFVQKYGPFCLIEYENDEDENFEAVFKNAKESGKLFCLSCVLEKINCDWYGRIFNNVNAKFLDIQNIFDLSAIKNVRPPLCPYHSKVLKALFGLSKPYKPQNNATNE